MESVVEMRGITKRFPGVTANDRVDLAVQAGEVCFGKTQAGRQQHRAAGVGDRFGQHRAGLDCVEGQALDIAHGSGWVLAGEAQQGTAMAAVAAKGVGLDAELYAADQAVTVSPATACEGGERWWQDFVGVQAHQRCLPGEQAFGGLVGKGDHPVRGDAQQR